MSEILSIASRGSLIKRAESTFPFVLGASISAIMLIFRAQITAHFIGGSWSLTGLYGAIFNWAALQTGFLFSVYGFIAAKQGGFIEVIRHTVFMSDFMRYTRRSIIMGFILTFSSIPLIIINLNFKNGRLGPFLIVDLWIGLFVWAFLTFVRVAYIFGIIARVRDQERIPA